MSVDEALISARARYAREGRDPIHLEVLPAWSAGIERDTLLHEEMTEAHRARETRT